jgi:hypothetical protein
MAKARFKKGQWVWKVSRYNREGTVLIERYQVHSCGTKRLYLEDYNRAWGSFDPKHGMIFDGSVDLSIIEEIAWQHEADNLRAEYQAFENRIGIRKVNQYTQKHWQERAALCRNILKLNLILVRYRNVDGKDHFIN